MSLTIEDYNELENLFEGNQELISSVSFKDYSFLSNELLKSLDGTLNGVEELEIKSNKWINFIKSSNVSIEVKNTITKSICMAYSRIILHTAK